MMSMYTVNEKVFCFLATYDVGDSNSTEETIDVGMYGLQLRNIETVYSCPS